MDDKYKTFRENSTVSRIITNRSLLISPDKTATLLLQLEAKSRIRSDKWNWDQARGFANPQWCLNFLVSKANKTAPCQSGVSDTTLAISTLVSNHPQDVRGLPSLTSSHPGHNPEPHKSGVHNEARGPSGGRRDSFAS